MSALAALSVRRRAIGLLVCLGAVLAACGDDRVADPDEVDPASINVEASATQRPKPEVLALVNAPTELVVSDLVEGDGPTAAPGDTVVVHYVGVISTTGVEFDNSYDRGQPFEIVLGVGSVIQGWDEGLIGVKPNGRRRLDIPAALAYGDQGAGGVIGPGESISFIVDVIDVIVPEPVTLPPQAAPSECPAVDGSSPQQRSFGAPPPMCIDVTKSYTAEVVTNLGSLTIQLHPDRAPMTVNSFVVLARYRYFDGLNCHRVIPGFVAQCGDPAGDGTGGPGYTIVDELPGLGEYEIGSVAMANAGPNTSGSQFFIITGPDGAALQPNYSLFGTVIAGSETVAALDAAGNPANNGVPPLQDVLIESVTITES